MSSRKGEISYWTCTTFLLSSRKSQIASDIPTEKSLLIATFGATLISDQCSSE